MLATVCRSQAAGDCFTAFFITLPMIQTSGGAIAPIESMPPFFQVLSLLQTPCATSFAILRGFDAQGCRAWSPLAPCLWPLLVMAAAADGDQRVALSQQLELIGVSLASDIVSVPRHGGTPAPADTWRVRQPGWVPGGGKRLSTRPTPPTYGFAAAPSLASHA